jgi:glycosyltransferase involved in cell wall biosynthesis
LSAARRGEIIDTLIQQGSAVRGFFAPPLFYFKDWLRFSSAFSLAASLGLACRGYARSSPRGSHLAELCRAARCCPSRALLRRLECLIRSELVNVDAGILDWGAVCPGEIQSRTIQKSIILKPFVPNREKGVLYVTFENQWIKILRSGQAQEIAKCYDMILGPTWSPPHDASLLAAARIWPGEFYSLLSNLDDAATMRRLSSKIRPLPLLASSWTNPVIYEPYLNLDKTIDILMIATFSKYKRHWLFFDTLRKLPRTLRVVLIGRPIGERTEASLREEAATFGVADRFELWKGASDDQIAQAICQSRISLIFSRQEGSCVAVAESMMGGTPVGLFRNARVGSKAFVNARTGLLLEQRLLARQILGFLDRHDRYEPRDWAIENISCYASTRVLNRAMCEESRTQGREWTRDVVTMHQNSVPVFVDDDDAREMLTCYQDFRDRYGLEIVMPNATVSSQVKAAAAPQRDPR